MIPTVPDMEYIERTLPWQERPVQRRSKRLWRIPPGTELGWLAVFTSNPDAESPVLVVSMVEDVKERGGSGYVVDKVKGVLAEYFSS